MKPFEVQEIWLPSNFPQSMPSQKERAPNAMEEGKWVLRIEIVQEFRVSMCNFNT